MLSLLIGVIGPITMIAQTELISRVERVVNGQLSFRELYVPFIINFGLMISTNINLIYDYLHLKMANIVELMNVKKIKLFLQKISFSAFEDPAVYDKVKYLGDNNIYALKLNLLLHISGFVVSTFLYIFILFRYSWVLPAIIFIFAPVAAHFSSKYANFIESNFHLLQMNERQDTKRKY